MREVRIYVEGGGNTEKTKEECRAGFLTLFEKCGFKGRMPRIIACGSRREAYDRFKSAQRESGGNYVALLVDSEDRIADIEKPWEHLEQRKDDNMPRPFGATDEQAFLMVTCMETWIIADRDALKRHYGDKFQETALPALMDLEQRDRHAVQDALAHATRECSNQYEKGKRSFRALSELTPATLEICLPSFLRVRRILSEKL